MKIIGGPVFMIISSEVEDWSRRVNKCCIQKDVNVMRCESENDRGTSLM